jgi:hypothetical protein
LHFETENEDNDVRALIADFGISLIDGVHTYEQNFKDILYVKGSFYGNKKKKEINNK